MPDRMNGRVVTLPASAHWKPDQAIAAMAKKEPEQVVLLGTRDGDLIIYSSSMSRAEVNWILDKAKEHCLHGGG